MDFALLLQYVNVVFRELWQRKFLALGGFAFVSFIVLGIGMFWPAKFETSATLYADNQNILGPLLEEQAEQNRVEDRAKVVQEKLFSPRMLTSVAKKIYGAKTEETPASLSNYIASIRARLNVKSVGSGYIRIEYSDSTSDAAYKGLNAVVDTFIRSSSEEQRAESREAFGFIDNQVKQYKDQLVLAEERLKQFAAQNFDGRDSDVSASIRRFRDQIEELKISIDEDLTTKRALEEQIQNESEFAATTRQTSAYALRLQELESRLSSLLLTYTEDYPDVISIRYQIADLKRVIEDEQFERATDQNTNNGPAEIAEGSEVLLNPLYQELRSRISQAETDIRAKRKRLTVLDELLEKEFDRRQRVAERTAEESELLRDYDVTKKIYEDMLERKEKARLSMTLNIEGQGVTYRIQEPPLPPLKPSGLRFIHFVLVGPFVGLLFIIGLAVSYVILDPRIRFSSALSDIDVRLLAAIPHINTPLTQRLLRSDMIVCGILGVAIIAVYISLAAAFRFGVLG